MSLHILHISDLHLEDFTPKDKDLIKSRFRETNFENKLFSSIKTSGFNLDYIIITGDLANIGTSVEYKEVERFLEKMSANLAVEKNHILICPGNHDVNWQKSQKAFFNEAANAANSGEEIPNENESYSFHNQKFEDFKQFYETFYKSEGLKFDPQNAVFRDVNESLNNVEIQICLINSCFKESHHKENHEGFIDHESFEGYLKQSKNDVLKVAVLHHVPVVFNDPKSISNWDSEIKYLCNTHNVRLFLFGHQHKSQSSKISDGKHDFLQLSVGTLGKNDSDCQNTFNLLTLDYLSDSAVLQVTRTPYQYIYHSDEPDWMPLTTMQVVEKLSYQKPAISEPIPVKLPGNDNVVYRFPKRIEQFSDSLLEIVTEYALFSSGHFHWSKSTRTLGFIDTLSLLSKWENSKVAKGGILELFRSHNLKSEFIIGLGQEGNVLGGFLAMTTGLPFTSIPYFSRKEDYSKQEKDLNINGCKNITIVTDVIYSATSVMSIIKEKVKSFEHVERIDLLSLFYISKEKEYNPEMFNSLDNRLHYYTVSDKIKIDKCGCTNDEHESCSIFCNKLEKIHVFHS